jgi:predicted AlkP superfamily pyrophosphatase or phosphodiesterase
MKMRGRDWISALRFAFLALVLGVAGFAPGGMRGQAIAAPQTNAPTVQLAAPITVERGPNTPEQQAKPYVIVANVFYDPARKQVYSYKDEQSVTDGTWYGGTPLWVLAEQQGMRSACFFWPGSEANIQGVLPTYYMKYDAKYPNRKRVEQVLEWLQLPAERRPHFLTLYFSDVDSAGHAHGPDSPEVASAVREVDDEIGRLVEGVAKLNLRVDVIVVADHGMTKVEGIGST